jgi:hypothetical protein
LLPQDEQEVKAELGEEKAQPSSSSSKPQEPAGEPPVPDKDLNRRVALLSTLGAVGLFASQRFKLGGFSLKDLAANAVPYEEVSDSSSLNSVLNNVKTTYAGKRILAVQNMLVVLSVNRKRRFRCHSIHLKLASATFHIYVDAYGCSK